MPLQDPLSYRFSGKGVDTSMPLFIEGWYPFQIVESVIQSNKKQTGHNWHLKAQLTSPQKTSEGKEIPVNTPVFLDVALQPSEDAKDPRGFEKKIYQTQDGISGTSMENRPDFDNAYVQSCIGRNVEIHVYPDEYPTGSGNFNNKVKAIRQPKG